MAKLHTTVSMSDIVRHPMYKELAGKENGFDAILFSMGMDIKRDIEVLYCEHRSELTKEVHTCDRYVGYTRTDDSWKEFTRLINSPD